MEKIFAQLLNIDEDSITSYNFFQDVEYYENSYQNICTAQEPHYRVYTGYGGKYYNVSLIEILSKMAEMLEQLKTNPTIIYSNSDLCD